MKSLLLFLILIFPIVQLSYSQDLSKHRWNDRLVLILTNDSTNATYQKQLDELYSERNGLEDRRLLIYTVLPDKYKLDNIAEDGWIESSSLYSAYKKNVSEPFEILLIGLDGGVKLRQSEFLSNENLFARIDRMPMRRRELQERKGEN